MLPYQAHFACHAVCQSLISSAKVNEFIHKAAKCKETGISNLPPQEQVWDIYGIKKQGDLKLGER
jgi:hypothetical protein